MLAACRCCSPRRRALAACRPPDFDAARRERCAKLRRARASRSPSSRTARSTLARGYGVRKLGAPGAVDADTIFPTGSTGKAFTAAALAILVDEGKIGWDDKVIDHMPDFRMYDPWVTREMTMRDLLVHRSGLGLGAGRPAVRAAHATSPAPSRCARLRYIKPATSFRSGYAYDNILYMVAGQLIEEVSGQTWEQFMREQRARARRHDPRHRRRRRPPRRRQPRPAARAPERRRSAASATQSRSTRTRCSPQRRRPGRRACDQRQRHGALAQHPARPRRAARRRAACSARRSRARCGRPVVLHADRAAARRRSRATQPSFSTYALGWNVRDYRGAQHRHARRRRVRLDRDGGADPRAQRRLLHRAQQRGERACCSGLT